jgi:hypothetical protein
MGSPVTSRDWLYVCLLISVWDLIQFMHTVSEIAITRCMMPPSLVGDLCAPTTTVEQDAIKGNWVRVDRDLNKQAGLWTLVRTVSCYIFHDSPNSL